ncbi:MAG: Ribonuclease Y [Parcubacteria group bacterium GW2011_GWC1_41_7]|nr:MAG: Ribonuclease Y [Parcubacteria group bacterium GW2011_GWC1_41_7]
MNPLTLLGLAVGIGIGFFARYLLAKKNIASVESQIQNRLEEVKRTEDKIVLEAEKKAVDIVEKANKDKDRMFDDVRQRESRLTKREELLDMREKEVLQVKGSVEQRVQKVEVLEKEISQQRQQITAEFERITSLSREEALKILFDKVQKEHEEELKERMVKLKNFEKDELQKEALEVVLNVLPRYSRTVVDENTTTTITLPNDEMKGRIIGKEGRNIRHFENLTGVEVIIDETPGVVTLSCYDPVRREISAIAINKLLKDGRIHPATIEESILWSQEKVEEDIREAGKAAAYELGILDLPEDVIHLMGRLKFRTSYGQNVLSHSIEVAHFSRMIAEELGLDKDVAKKAGFLHDVGKSVDHQIEGTHLEIGIRILEKYKVSEKVILAMRSHHETYPFAVPEAYVVLAADAISAKRLGARGETGEMYIKRLEDLERIASETAGVEKAYAISGGRELRVFVKSEEITDFEMLETAKGIAKRIEKDLRYPGEIKVIVIREKRAVEYAR